MVIKIPVEQLHLFKHPNIPLKKGQIVTSPLCFEAVVPITYDGMENGKAANNGCDILICPTHCVIFSVKHFNICPLLRPD